MTLAWQRSWLLTCPLVEDPEGRSGLSVYLFLAQLWDSIVRHLSHSAADTHSVLYVSPVVISDDDAAVSCMAAAACDTAREVLTGVATGTTYAYPSHSLSV